MNYDQLEVGVVYAVRPEHLMSLEPAMYLGLCLKRLPNGLVYRSLGLGDAQSGWLVAADLGLGSEDALGRLPGAAGGRAAALTCAERGVLLASNGPTEADYDVGLTVATDGTALPGGQGGTQGRLRTVVRAVTCWGSCAGRARWEQGWRAPSGRAWWAPATGSPLRPPPRTR